MLQVGKPKGFMLENGEVTILLIPGKKKKKQIFEYSKRNSFSYDANPRRSQLIQFFFF